MPWWVVPAIIAAVVGGLTYKAARDAQKAAKKAADAMRGVLLNKESNIEGIPVIYGTRRVGGTRVFVHAEGSDKNKYLYICLVLCEGEVDDIYDIEIDNHPISDSSRWGAIEEITTDTSTVPRIIYRNTKRRRIWRSYIHRVLAREKILQVASSILSDSTKWGSNHKLNGVAYLGIRLRWNQDKFSGMPNITAVVKGKRYTTQGHKILYGPTIQPYAFLIT